MIGGQGEGRVAWQPVSVPLLWELAILGGAPPAGGGVCPGCTASAAPGLLGLRGLWGFGFGLPRTGLGKLTGRPSFACLVLLPRATGCVRLAFFALFGGEGTASLFPPPTPGWDSAPRFWRFGRLAAEGPLLGSGVHRTGSCFSEWPGGAWSRRRGGRGEALRPPQRWRRRCREVIKPWGFRIRCTGIWGATPFREGPRPLRWSPALDVSPSPAPANQAMKLEIISDLRGSKSGPVCRLHPGFWRGDGMGEVGGARAFL